MRKMNKFWLIIMVLILGLTLLTGCGSEPAPTTPAPQEQPQEQEPVAEKPEIIPVDLDPNLSYVDTAYLENLMNAVRPTSERILYEQAPPEWEFFLIDSRPAVRYNESHINGAVNIPDSEFDNFPCRLPADLDMQVIFYCGGLDCPLSANSARKAIELGYTNVHVYQEGTPFWKEAGNYFITTPEYVSTLITEDRANDTERKPFLIIDARPYNMYFQSHIPTSVQMDDAIFEEKYLASMPQDKGTEIVAYCGGFFCGKSHFIAQVLVDEGYTNVKVLAGGNPAWKDAGYPLFGAEASGGSFDVSGSDKPNRALNAEQWKSKLETEGNVAVIDVRNVAEVASGMITGAIHIPDADIHKDPQAIASKLPADKNTTLLIHCAVGARSAGVVEKIAALGYENVFYLNQRITIDAEGNYNF